MSPALGAAASACLGVDALDFPAPFFGLGALNLELLWCTAASLGALNSGKSSSAGVGCTSMRSIGLTISKTLWNQDGDAQPKKNVHAYRFVSSGTTSALTY